MKSTDIFTMETLETLDAEYNFWMTYRLAPSITSLNRYYSSTDLPRPESYREDTELASESTQDPSSLYTSLAAGAESGWDFSSRWL